jgi:pSer/pThr/pTyr-binding forkhead associated (FHA) protein
MPPLSQNDGDPLAPHSLSAAELQELLVAEGAGSPFLAYRDELGLMRIFPVANAERPFMVGRSPEVDLAITWDGEVSGIHAELKCLGGEVTVADDGLSTNGTYVNEQRVVGRVRLRDRDRLRLGRTLLAYRSGSRSAALATVAAKDAPSLLRLTDMQKSVLVSLCRPLRAGTAFATPATNQQIASEVYLSIDAVKMHLRNLFAKFDLTELPQNQKRARLAEAAMRLGLVTERDLL